MNRLGFGRAAKIGKLVFWVLLLAETSRLLPAALGDGAVPPASPNPECCVTSPVSASPPIWGVAGIMGYPAGKHEAPNGLVFDPLVGLTADLSVGLLPRKQLYLFLQSDLWVQSSAVGAPSTSQREFDAHLGVAWNYFDSLELRAPAYALNNLNRGFSLVRPDGYKDGSNDNRYYLGSGDIYDVGTLPFVDIGYYPSGSLVGNNGQVFHPGLFASGYVTQNLPTPFRSYLYGGLQLTAQSVANPRLLDTDIGLAIRPFSDHQGFELRVGYNRIDDVQAHVTRQLGYGAMRVGLGMGSSEEPSAPSSTSWPEIWGVVGLPIYPAGNRMAPNGVPFQPIFSVTNDLNLGLLPDKELYVFYQGVFWAQHPSAAVTHRQNSIDFSKREVDSNWGWRGNISMRWSCALRPMP